MERYWLLESDGADLYLRIVTVINRFADRSGLSSGWAEVQREGSASTYLVSVDALGSPADTA